MGNFSDAARLFDQAWTESSNDYERCIAAHYVARHQPTTELALRWNQEAVHCAGRIADEGVAEFLPSLYLNLGKSQEDLGNAAEALRLYQCAAEKIECLAPGAYRDIVHDGIERGLRRIRDSMQSL